jgi:predicted Na+-dependent transporter
MFSRKNFTWKKWLAITVYMFVVTLLISWLLSLLLKEPPESRSQFFTSTSLAGRLFAATLSGTFLSFMRFDRKT